MSSYCGLKLNFARKHRYFYFHIVCRTKGRCLVEGFKKRDYKVFQERLKQKGFVVLVKLRILEF